MTKPILAAFAAFVLAVGPAAAQNISPGTPLPAQPAGSTGDIQYNNAGAPGAISPSTATYVLTSNGAGVAPSFQAPTGGGGGGGCGTPCTVAQTITLSTANTSYQIASGGNTTTSNTTPAFNYAWTLNNTTGAVDVFKLAVSCVTACPSSNLMNLYGGAAGTTSEFSVTSAGNVTAAGNLTAGAAIVAGGNIIGGGGSQIQVGSNGVLCWAGGGCMWSGNTNDIHIGKDTGTAVSQNLGFMSSTTANTAGANATITASLGNGSGAGGDILFKTAATGTTTTTALTISKKGVPVLPGFTVATLPASPPTGSFAYVTDATSCTFLGALTGGGATVCPVFYNGTAWVGH